MMRYMLYIRVLVIYFPIYTVSGPSFLSTHCKNSLKRDFAVKSNTPREPFCLFLLSQLICVQWTLCSQTFVMKQIWNSSLAALQFLLFCCWRSCLTTLKLLWWGGGEEEEEVSWSRPMLAGEKHWEAAAWQPANLDWEESDRRGREYHKEIITKRGSENIILWNSPRSVGIFGLETFFISTIGAAHCHI